MNGLKPFERTRQITETMSPASCGNDDKKNYKLTRAPTLPPHSPPGTHLCLNHIVSLFPHLCHKSIHIYHPLSFHLLHERVNCNKAARSSNTGTKENSKQHLLLSKEHQKKSSTYNRTTFTLIPKRPQKVSVLTMKA